MSVAIVKRSAISKDRDRANWPLPVDPSDRQKIAPSWFAVCSRHGSIIFQGGFLIGIGSWHRSEAHRLIPSFFPQSKHQHRGRQERNAEENQPTVKAPCAFADRAYCVRANETAKISDGIDQSDASGCRVSG
jgi:hypothetical protein